MNNINIDQIIETMESIGFNHVDGLSFEDDYNEVDIEFDDLEIDLGQSHKKRYKVFVEDHDEIVVNIPDDEIMSAKQIMNGTNPDCVDAHPLALLYIKGKSSTKNTIKKAVSDERFWQQRHKVKRSCQSFEHDDIDIILDTGVNQ